MFYYSMKPHKNSIISLLIFFLVLTVSCFGQKQLHIVQKDDRAFIVPVHINKQRDINIFDLTLRMDVQVMDAFVTAKHSFILYIGSSTCYYCTLIEPHLISYLSSDQTVLYYIDTKSEAWNMFIYKYQEYLSFRGTPSIFFINNGVIVQIILGAKLNNKNEVRKAFRQATKRGYYYVDESIRDFVPSNKKALRIDYDCLDHSIGETFTKIIYPFLKAPGCFYVSYSKNLTHLKITYYQRSKIIKTIEYSALEHELLKNDIDLFFN